MSRIRAIGILLGLLAGAGALLGAPLDNDVANLHETARPFCPHCMIQ